MAAYAQIVDIDATSLTASINGELASYAYTQIVDINVESLCDPISGELITGIYAQIADINALSLTDSIVAELLIGVHTKVVNIDAISLCGTILGQAPIGDHDQSVNIDTTSYCRPIPAVLITDGLYIAFDIRHGTEDFIRSPLIPVIVSGTARPRACATEFRVYLYAGSYEGRVIEHLTVRWNLDDKRFVRGIYASKAPTG